MKQQWLWLDYNLVLYVSHNLLRATKLNTPYLHYIVIIQRVFTHQFLQNLEIFTLVDFDVARKSLQILKFIIYTFH